MTQGTVFSSKGVIHINFKDITGFKFGRWTVIQRVEDKILPCGERRVMWLCQCECGKKKELTTSTLTSGHSKSCGCLQKELASKNQAYNLVGKRFGKLTVIKRIDQPKNLKLKRDAYWLCKCDCGSEKEIIKTTYDLTSGNTKSCGCLRRESFTNKKYNTYDLSGEYGVGYTFKGEEFYFDLEDYDKIKGYYWYFNDNGYLITPKNETTKERIRLHRLIMNACKGIEVDHIQHNKNDNRKENLRLVTTQQNGMNKSLCKNNTSGITGVYWNKNSDKWNVKIGFNGKSIDLGFYLDFNDAVYARKEAEEFYFGEYSYDRSINRNNNTK